MRFFQYKPAEYVNVHPDIPLEWMQGQVNASQKRYDLQKEAVDKATENWLNVKYGELGKAEYDRLKQQYEGRFEGLTDQLNIGDVTGASRDFAKLIRETAMDPGLKNLQEEYKAYSEFQKNLLNPEYAGSVNTLPYAIQAGLQMGEELPLSQAIQYYQLAKPQNSLEDVEKTLQSFKASTIDGKTWTINDPLTGKPLVSGDEEYIKGLSKARIKETLDSYYNNWVISGKSLNDKRRILQEEGLDPIKDMGVFNTLQGKQLYDKYSNFLLGYTYEEKTPITPQTTSAGTRGGTKSETDGDKEKPFIPITSTTYGYQNGNGSIFNKVNNDGSVTPINLDGREGYNLSFEYLLDEKESLITEMENLQRTGGSVEQKKALDEKIKQNERTYNILANEQENIEADLYLTASDNNKLEAAKQQANREWVNVQSQKTDSKVGESIKITPAEKAQWIHNKVIEILGKDSPEGKLIERYKQYNNNYLTSGKAYMVVDSDNVELLTGVMQNFQNKTIKYKDPLTDQELNIDDINDVIPKNENGVPDYKRLSYEMLLDERDGPVLVIHGVDGENKSKAYEVPLENFGNVREFFGNMLSPEEQAYMTKFVEATQSIKASQNKNTGSFSVNRFDGSTNEIDFNREKIGKGKYAYKVQNSSDGTEDKMYGSMEEMIYGEILPYTIEDSVVKTHYDRMMQAVKTRNFETASYEMNFINKYMTGLEMSKKKSSSVSSNQFNESTIPSIVGPETSRLIEKYESNQGPEAYNTLYGHSQRKGGKFEGINVSNMTIAEILAFQNPSGEYGQWVKQNNPNRQVSTPVGKYQFVGTTLRQVVNNMGLPKETVFTPEVQDKIFNYHIKNRLDSASTVDEKRRILRAEWEGFKSASNKELDAIINEYSA
jgi:hypothetical protein